MRHNTLVVLCLFLFFAVGCSKNDQEAQPQAAAAATSQPVAVQPVAQPRQPVGFATVSPQQAEQMIQAKKGLVMIDVRTPQELVNGFIAGSHNVPLWPVMKGQLNLPKDTPLLVICAVGGRSYAAGQALVKWGFQEVYNLSGGIDAWKQAGLPLRYN